MEKDCFC
ncbi:hypothetical protein NGA_0198900 [Nannochloropsis gaditana CCMP526]|nr:hypothetical protein NGA_0198900 [Nannochloropsis gaditana CCMP526]EKU21969.1 hypothetical protein NGA_0198900 [Nannochloropsis gaditana CCMP526]|eukprot:XP_005854391.1 hypothetical protein NGA_0198900 [Nannochloropsis gaditana CCMP526]